MLSVWLPLTEDLRNQGLFNLPASSLDTRIRYTDGKLGQYCYGDCAIYHIGQEWLGNTWSLACWVKSSSWSTYNDIILCKNADSSTSAQFYFSIIGGSQLNIGCNAGAQTLTTSYTFATNTWYHVAATYDGTTLKLYLNGNEIASQAYASVQKTGMNNLCIGCRSSNTSGTSATGQASKRMNDVRIYDTALSPREVKEISKGLVLHYPLNRGGFGGENLLKNSHNKYDNNGYYVGTYTFVDSSKLETGKTYTLSFNGELQDDTQTGWYFNIFPSPYTAIINKPTDKEGRFAFSFVMPENGGNRTSIGCYSLPLGNRLGCAIWDVKLEKGSTATPWIPAPSDALYSQMGLDNNIVYDTSGYGNNGELYAYDTEGSITVESDTPRYNVSTHIASTNTTTSTATGTRYIYGHCSLTNPTEMTVTFWAKPISAGYRGSSTAGNGIFCTTNYKYGSGSVGTDYVTSAMNHRDGTVDINDSASTAQCRPSLNVTLNEWHHYAITYDGQVGRVYKDGVQSSTAQFSSPKTLDSFIGVVIGFSGAGSAWRSNDAYYSDFRIYATALSAEDVYNLYTVGASLSDTGVLFSNEVSEV